MSTAPEVLPLRPADERGGLGANPQHAPTRPRTRGMHLPMPSAAAVSGILQGGSLLGTAPAAVLTVWAGHRHAANYYRHWFMKGPRLAYGLVHAFIEAPLLYLWVWSGRSPVLRIAVLATVLIILRLLGVHVLWSWL